MKIAITGASGKTGYRISEEAVKKGYKVGTKMGPIKWRQRSSNRKRPKKNIPY